MGNGEMQQTILIASQIGRGGIGGGDVGTPYTVREAWIFHKFIENV